MEIVLLAQNGLKIKGKQSTVLLNSVNDTSVSSAILSFDTNFSATHQSPAVIINNPGEYEVGGIKITGLRSGRSGGSGGSGDTTVFSLKIDGLEVLVGEIEAIEKIHQKLKEHNIVVLYVDKNMDASFVTGLAVNGVLFYGVKASEVIKTFAKDNVQEMSKYQTTLEKIPLELETILLK